MSLHRPKPANSIIAASSHRVFLIEIDGKTRRIELKTEQIDGSYEVTLDGNPVSVQTSLLQPGVLSLIVGGRAYRCVLDQGPVENAVQFGGKRFVYRKDDPRSLTSRRGKIGAAEGLQTIKAPMPGRIVRLLVEIGQRVEAKQGVVVIEAMKMQNELRALRAGKVVEIKAAAGDTVTAGQILLTTE